MQLMSFYFPPPPPHKKPTHTPHEFDSTVATLSNELLHCCDPDGSHKHGAADLMRYLQRF